MKLDSTINQDIIDYVNAILDGKDIPPITVGFVSDKAANEIEKLTGKYVYGNRIVLDSNGVKHIILRHGKNGQQDHSMENIQDIAKIGYVLSNYDKIEYHNDSAQGYVDKDGKSAPIIIVSKELNGTFYIIEAVSDAKKKRNYIVSAYIKK